MSSSELLSWNPLSFGVLYLYFNLSQGIFSFPLWFLLLIHSFFHFHMWIFHFSFCYRFLALFHVIRKDPLYNFSLFKYIMTCFVAKLVLRSLLENVLCALEKNVYRPSSELLWVCFQTINNCSTTMKWILQSSESSGCLSSVRVKVPFTLLRSIKGTVESV